MYLGYIFLIIYICESWSMSNDIDLCHYEYSNRCTQSSQCILKKPIHVNFTVMLDDTGHLNLGIVKVDFRPSTINCKFKIALLVNPAITSISECKNYQFNDSFSSPELVHTPEKNVCFQNNSFNENLFSCNDENLTFWYEYVYTGCYSLRFSHNGTFVYTDNTFLETDYKKTEVNEPKFMCTYMSYNNIAESDYETVSISTDLSINAGSSGLILDLSLISPLDVQKENACLWHSRDPVLSLSMKLEESDLTLNNCSLSLIRSSDEQHFNKVECNFDLKAPRNVGYCLLIRILDGRCHKYTSWNPPLKDKMPCSWMQRCVRIGHRKSRGSIEMSKEKGLKNYIAPSIIYVVILFAATVIIFTIVSVAVILCQKFTKRKISLKGNTVEKKLPLELSYNYKSLREKLLKESGILVMYVRGSDEFMSTITDFKNILSQRTGCDVYDWWSPDKWNDVASVGGYEWAIKMMKRGCRVVWIDTLKARALLASRSKKRFGKIKNSYPIKNFEVRDFRDAVFSTIVDYVRRNSQETDVEYQKHYIVRFEDFEAADKIEDPFADLSPYARYLIPHNLDSLCHQLSNKEILLDEDVNLSRFHLKNQTLFDLVVDL